MTDEEETPRIDDVDVDDSLDRRQDDDNVGYGQNDDNVGYAQNDDNVAYGQNDDEDDGQIRAMNDIFSRFKDDPYSDYINVNRLTEILQAFGRNPSQRDAEQRITELEMSGKTELTLEDVLQIVQESWTAVNNDRDALRQALERFDQNREGYIDVERFRTIMTTSGEPLNDDEFQELIQLGLNEDQTKVNIDYLLDQLLGTNA